MGKKMFGGTDMLIAGWGQLESGIRSRFPEVLQDNIVQVLSVYGCSRKFSTRLQSSQVCAGGNAGHDVCAGDSGGPLMLPVGPEDGPKKHYLYGLVSFGMPCNHQSSAYVFGVYTKVSSFLTWILDNIEE
ncbi:phenoloxidase-activating factor 1-like [Homalodisca vitripennis]|uniref:phenoloxidase-activating factor 1-like n=1 Tax=Homalodisca vitripennis TaxID=197043 RepID=UPI001EEAFF36|nr:phenoloxidase-activating factor 1-like [Homalodisca vitripennis]